jgi:hypothetical protein
VGIFFGVKTVIITLPSTSRNETEECNFNQRNDGSMRNQARTIALTPNSLERKFASPININKKISLSSLQAKDRSSIAK